MLFEQIFFTWTWCFRVKAVKCSPSSSVSILSVTSRALFHIWNRESWKALIKNIKKYFTHYKNIMKHQIYFLIKSKYYRIIISNIFCTSRAFSLYSSISSLVIPLRDSFNLLFSTRSCSFQNSFDFLLGQLIAAYSIKNQCKNVRQHTMHKFCSSLFIVTSATCRRFLE